MAEKTLASEYPVFTFRRMSGLDQVTMQTDDEWRNLDLLPAQIWMALSCPTSGLEFNIETLNILDADGDGHVRAQDVRDAVAWVCQRVKHPASLTISETGVDPENLRDDTSEGQGLLAAAKLVREKSGSEEAVIPLEKIETVLTEANGYPFNGDGVVPPDSAPETEEKSGTLSPRAFTLLMMSVIGAQKDASGKPGLTKELADEAAKRLQAALDWRKKADVSRLPLGEKTAEAWTLFERLAPKIDDFFCRCDLATFDPDALAALNTQDSTVPQEAQKLSLINAETLRNLPLARVAKDGVLSIDAGVNPAWTKDLKEFLELSRPLADDKTLKSGALNEKAWSAIKTAFGDYAQILADKPSWPTPPADAEVVASPGMPTLSLAPADDPLGRAYLPVNPDVAVENLTDTEISAALNPKIRAEFDKLVELDLAAPPLSSIQDLRKLALFRGYLYVFLMNFLSFMDFYDPDKKAIFQEGILYLDSRACLLCVPVDDVDNHARLAAQSHLCLIYCACTRKSEDGADQTMNIAAALTMGNMANLIEGRHGLFIDNAGKEWDTQIIRVAHNPISLREAAWAPYIRASNMIAEQAQKFIAAKDKMANDAVAKVTTNVTAPPPPKEKAGFDFAKGAGIFAALSVAVSMLSAAAAYIANSLASLGWWWPLALVMVFICVSGPSMLIAYFKLRKRSLGPLLDASGWAVNKGAPINLIMGMGLTLMGKLPPNAKRDFNDPYGLPAQLLAKKRRAKFWTWFIIILILLIMIAAGCFWLYCRLVYEPVWVTKLLLFLGW